MKYSSNYRNMKRRDSLDEAIKEVFDKFDDYFDEEISCYSTVSFKGKTDENKCVEITIKAGKYTFRAESITDDFLKSIDEDYEKIKKQIRRNKDKIISKKRDIPKDLFSTDEEPEQFELIRRKSFIKCPMTESEAAMQMEMLGHNFFMFFNSTTEEINVIYKRDNGGYGLIEMTE